MDDDDDNDERGEQENEDDEEPAIRSYSKKKHFGKSSRDLKLFGIKTVYKPRIEAFKPFKFTLEAAKYNLADSLFNAVKFRLDHKANFMTINSSTKLNLSFKRDMNLQSYDLNSKLKKSFESSTLSLSTKLNNKQQFNMKLTNSLRWWEKVKLQYSFDLDRKKDPIVLGTGLNAQFKRSMPGFERLPFITSYNELVGCGFSLKSNLKNKLDAFYKGHFINTDQHRLYFEHRFAYEFGGKLSNTLNLNIQDSLAIATFNGSLNFEGAAIKTKEVRMVIEFDKIYRLGLQKRNDSYQAIFERYKIKYGWLKSVKLYLGNKSFVSAMQGRIKFWKSPFDYKLNFRLKPQFNNFFQDSSLGLDLKWNL